MPEIYQVVGQTVGTASITTYATWVTVPSATTYVLSTLLICNTAASSATYSIAIQKTSDDAYTSTSTPAAKDWIIKGAAIPASDTITLTIGLTLEATRVIKVASSAVTVTFAAFGAVVT